VRIGDTVVLDGDLSLIIPVDGESGIVTKVIGQDLPTYTGVIEVTPTTTEQVLDTSNKVVTRNIVINPIPSNYGLITWNGSTLTVS
jgi:hypothetical protein